MPIITINMMEGRSTAQKHRLMKNVTQAVAASLDVPESTVRIIISEIVSGHFSVAGTPRFADAPQPGPDTSDSE